MATPLDEFPIEYGWGENTKPCPECKGTGSVTLFVSVSPCKPCEGTGRIASPPHYAPVSEGLAGRPGYPWVSNTGLLPRANSDRLLHCP